MPYPNLPDKLQGTPILTGQEMIAYRRQTGRFPDIAPPESVVICLETGLPRKARRRYPYRKAGRFVGDLLMLRKTRGKVGVMANFGMGAPTVAAMVEELSAWGVQSLALISLAAALQTDLAAGDIVVCDQAIRDEGTSYHYLPGEKHVRSGSELTSDLIRSLRTNDIPHTTGTTWTTDAPYRETEEEVRSYQAEGVLTVEMETAALFSIGKVHGVQTAAAYVVGDSLAHLHWQRPTNMQAIDRSFLMLYAAIIEMLDAV